MPEGFSERRTLGHGLVLHHWAVRKRKVVEILPSHRTSASNASASVCCQRWARYSQNGWPAVSPPLGAFNPPATEGVPTACRTDFQLALCNLSWPISTFFRAIRSEVFSSLSFPFPRSLGTTANPTPKSGKVWFFRIFGRFFRLPNRAGKMILKKHRKNCENKGFAPPKTLPKSFQKPSKINVPKNVRFFMDLWSKNASLHKRRHQFRIGFYSVFFACRTLFLVPLFACMFDLKNLPKILPKRNPIHSKIDAENILFFYVGFV